MADVRAELFNEGPDADCPYRLPGWRGCAFNPDRFNHTKLPRFLFESIVEAAASDSVTLAAYSPDQPPTHIAAEWTTFRSHRFDPKHWSLEYVLHDQSKSWAVLLDPDLVVFGAETALADRIDLLLSEHGTSLREITTGDFPELDPANSGHKYILGAISGCAP
jgi:hypothetical protein